MKGITSTFLPYANLCTASASAPTFFPPYKLPYNSNSFLPHIDGSVSANNPDLAAIAHALSMTTSNKINPKIEEIAVLSIGTGKTTYFYTYDEIKKWGLLGWVKNLTNIFLDPSAENSAYISRRILQSINSQNYLRLNFELNERLKGEQKPGYVRDKLDKPYNKYILKKEGKYQEISEEIDNPNRCQDLIKAAECYLVCGEVNYQGKKVSVQSVIQQFIEFN